MGNVSGLSISFLRNQLSNQGPVHITVLACVGISSKRHRNVHPCGAIGIHRANTVSFGLRLYIRFMYRVYTLLCTEHKSYTSKRDYVSPIEPSGSAVDTGRWIAPTKNEMRMGPKKHPNRILGVSSHRVFFTDSNVKIQLKSAHQFKQCRIFRIGILHWVAETRNGANPNPLQ